MTELCMQFRNQFSSLRHHTSVLVERGLLRHHWPDVCSSRNREDDFSMGVSDLGLVLFHTQNSHLDSVRRLTDISAKGRAGEYRTSLSCHLIGLSLPFRLYYYVTNFG